MEAGGPAVARRSAALVIGLFVMGVAACGGAAAVSSVSEIAMTRKVLVSVGNGRDCCLSIVVWPGEKLLLADDSCRAGIWHFSFVRLIPDGQRYPNVYGY